MNNKNKKDLCLIILTKKINFIIKLNWIIINIKNKIQILNYTENK